ncbi:transmembrane protein 94-like [Toxotes jaculatrix]|uniref:transmembrane protein 94-like n=1 Tax=Toxotes jaculatrix TaxID=941984 RepID=UPI001B3ADF69|nr:transmembrane protein 94-like [Toxotes jaculatrix]
MVKLIEQARHTTYGIRKCFLFLLQCQLSLVIIQFLACLAQLPPPMNTTDILWLSCFSCPLLSVSLLGKPPDTSVMAVATGKNLDTIPRKTQNYFLGCFLLKFALTVCAYLLVFGFTLQEVCLSRGNNTTITCHILTARPEIQSFHQLRLEHKWGLLRDTFSQGSSGSSSDARIKVRIARLQLEA